MSKPAQPTYCDLLDFRGQRELDLLELSFERQYSALDMEKFVFGSTPVLYGTMLFNDLSKKEYLIRNDPEIFHAIIFPSGY